MPGHQKSDERTIVIGDVHGHRAELVALLQAAGLVDPAESWSGGAAALWLIGDLADRGPDGAGVVRLVRRLQGEARRDGGFVGCLLGNHEALLLAAALLGDQPTTGPGGSFVNEWRLNGGADADLAALDRGDLAWLATLPACAGVGDALLVHADSLIYLEHGSSIDQVNGSFRSILASTDTRAWDELLAAFSRRREFTDPDVGVERAERLLATLGGRVIVHGHTPIARLLDVPASEIGEPLVYAGGRCVNVDPGLYLGGPGFSITLERAARVDARA